MERAVIVKMYLYGTFHFYPDNSKGSSGGSNMIYYIACCMYQQIELDLLYNGNPIAIL